MNYSWPEVINSKFFELKSKPKQNIRETSYASGRTTTILRNTRFVKEIECSIKLNVKTELPAFWAWYESIGGCAGNFLCSAIGTAYYRFSEVPSEENTDRTYRILSFKLEEVY